MLNAQCYFQLSPGGIFPPESQIPPRKTTKIQKTLKNASNLPPTYAVPPRARSLELTLLKAADETGTYIKYSLESLPIAAIGGNANHCTERA